MIGQTILHYKILAKLGEGGMGEVYLAEDSKLERKVALKFLPAQYTENIEINARFQREAKAAAKLNHPNIITIHEIGEHEGRAYIAMEYVNGQSLREAIVGETGRSPLQMPRIIDILSQVCAGLSKAHQAGIVHRDLKPENLMLDADGTVKILDFGLAQMQGKTRLTVERSTMGTLYYMSPEQFEGVDADHHADIWAVGVMLYEMATGRLPFEGKHEHSIIYSITNKEPTPLISHKTGVSPDLQRIVDKALDKDRDTRYQAITELLADLDRVRKSESVTVKRMSGIQKRKLARTLARYGAIPIVLAIIVIVALYLGNERQAEQIFASHKQVTFTGRAFSPAISPEGRFIAYISAQAKAGKNSLIVQDLIDGQSLEALTNDDSLAMNPPCWSPDDSEIITYAPNPRTLGALLIPRLGGNSRRIASVRYLPRWSPDGTQIASSAENWKVIRFTNISTGEFNYLDLPKRFTRLADMDWSPRGDRFAFITSDGERHAIWTTNLDETQQYLVAEYGRSLFSPRWSAKGDAIYFLRSDGQTKALMKIEIDAASGKAKGQALTLQTGLQIGESFTLSRDNKQLLYTRELHFTNLWLTNLGARNAQPRQITNGTLWIDTPAISPDNKKIAFSIGSRPKANIFVMPLEGGQMEQLTFLNSYNAGVAWSPDGKEIAFGSTQEEKTKVWRIAASGGTPRAFENALLSDDKRFQLTWSPGPDILYQLPGNQNFHILDPKTEQEKLLVVNAAYGWMFSPRYSPDAKRVALYWNRTSAVEGRPVGALWLVSPADTLQLELLRGPISPIGWAADGQGIYVWNFFKKPIEVMLIPANVGQARVVATLPFENIEDMCMSSDGKYLICVVAEHRSDIWVMEHFDPQSELAAPISTPEWPEGKLLTYEQKGASLLRQGKHAEAEPYFRQGLGLNPKHRRLLRGLGASLKNQRKYAEAEQVFRKGMDLYPEAIEFLQGLGSCLLQQARYTEAEGIFLKALELDPQHLSTLDGMVKLKIEVRDYEAAKRYAEKYKAAHAQFRKYGMMQLAQINLLEKNYPVAEKHLRETVKFDSIYAPAYRLLAYLSVVQEHYDEARRYAEKSLELDSSFASQNLMAWVLIVGEFNMAQGIAFAPKAYEAKPDDYAHTAKVYSYLAIPEHTLGLAYLKKGEYDKAVQYLEHAAAFAPERRTIQDDLQRASEKLQKMANP